MNVLIIWITKLISLFAKTLNLGAGSTWPGHIALKVNSKFIRETLKRNKHLKVILVAGTNGKTTTTTLLKFTLQKNGLKVFQNESGANLLNGVASSIIQHSNLNGKLNYDIALFEIDENTLPLILKELHPDAILILNLFRDQLDRYGEVNTIAKKWLQALQELPEKTKLFINGDDPQLSYIGHTSTLTTEFFGIHQDQMSKKSIPHDVDFLYCPSCRKKLVFERMSYSHMGVFKCNGCGFRRNKVKTFHNISYPLSGTYNIYNTNAAVLVAHEFFNISLDDIKRALSEFKPAFGRQEEVDYEGRKVKIILSKNPTGFNESLRTIRDLKAKYLLLVLNDRIPDGLDVSWIWDVDFEDNLSSSIQVHVSGDRAWDMALRIKYAHPTINHVNTHALLEKIIPSLILEIPEGETLYILPTYSAMLEVRKLLRGRKIL